jgi:hypothetical protein
VLEPVLAFIGSIGLRELDVTDVDRSLTTIAATRSSATVAMAGTQRCRTITRAQRVVAAGQVAGKHRRPRRGPRPSPIRRG